jgi:D-tyrosyl-tRNA(Tyr) deacylase
MRAVVQRVSQASVTVDQKKIASIGQGLLVLLGIEETDTEADIQWLSAKVLNLRIFDDVSGVMNLSLLETVGDLILVSQFTLFASTKKGNRPSYSRAAKSENAISLYEKMINTLSNGLGKNIQTGSFGADMKVDLCNDGPVTIIYDTKNKE